MAEEKLKSEEYALMGGINSKVSPYVNGPMEFRSIINMNFVTPGSLTKRPGTSLYAGATVAGAITGGIEFERLNGASYICATANTNFYTVTSSFNAIRTGLLNGAIFDFVVFVDRLFCANGQDFFKFDGTNTSNYSLPPGGGAFGVTSAIGAAPNGMSGTFQTGYGYLNDRGYFGPTSTGQSIFLNGITFGAITYYGLTAPLGYGITAIALYRSSSDGVDMFGTTFTTSTAVTSVTDTGFTLGTRISNFNLFFTLAPRYMEIYNNQLFMAGFSSMLSTAYWSEIGEPEAVDPTFFAEFRTNDGDRITGMKPYNGSLVVTKERSVHRVTGDNPNNFSFQEISDQYGCLSNQAMVVYENLLWFLDPKGIVEYNGANISVVSNPVEPIFVSMNVSAARDHATAIHYRQYNEVWFIIPTNGSSINNTVVVYDYLARAWTTYEGVRAQTLFLAKGSQPIKTVFYGGYTGSISYFGASLFGDNNGGITCSFKSHFLAATGHTIERQYRRYYLDLDPILGVTQPITMNFYTNFSASSSLTRTMYQQPYQSRIDFGLSAKSIQAEMFHVSASLPLKINGFTFESRFQRNV